MEDGVSAVILHKNFLQLKCICSYYSKNTGGINTLILAFFKVLNENEKKNKQKQKIISKHKREFGYIYSAVSGTIK